MSIGPLGTSFSEILMKIQNFSFKKMRLQIPFANFFQGGGGGGGGGGDDNSSTNMHQRIRPLFL